MNKKLTSIIVPIFNVDKYLKKCIDSIINQTDKNLEIILIDDGSTDQSGKICDDYKNIDKRIKVIHEVNRGLSNARNMGLDVAKGDYICFVDSDDYLEPNMLEELKKNMNKFDSDISICDYYNVKNGKRKRNNMFLTKEDFVSIEKEKFDNIQNDYSYLTVYAWNKLYKKEIFNYIRYPSGQIFEDSYILCDILNNAKKVSYLMKPLYNYVYRKDSITHKFSINHFDKINSFDKKIDFFNSNGYYDLVNEEKNRKMNCIIINFSKMKRDGIKNNEIETKYYKELIEINKDVKWKNATICNKIYKILGKPAICFFGLMLKMKKKLEKYL